jgi:cobalt-zinc-cadmium efflux system outer membrane protein
MHFQNRRRQLKPRRNLSRAPKCLLVWTCGILSMMVVAPLAFSQASAGPARITLEQAIQLAIDHNHSLLAARTTVVQNQAAEIQANVRPNPTLFTDWEYLPLVSTSSGLASYLHDSTEGDIGMSYMFERGQKRQHRLQAAKDATSVTRATVTDNERSLAFQVAQLYINAQLARHIGE